jgi:hypothetical protein
VLRTARKRCALQKKPPPFLAALLYQKFAGPIDCYSCADVSYFAFYTCPLPLPAQIHKHGRQKQVVVRELICLLGFRLVSFALQGHLPQQREKNPKEKRHPVTASPRFFVVFCAVARCLSSENVLPVMSNFDLLQSNFDLLHSFSFLPRATSTSHSFTCCTILLRITAHITGIMHWSLLAAIGCTVSFTAALQGSPAATVNGTCSSRCDCTVSSLVRMPCTSVQAR